MAASVRSVFVSSFIKISKSRHASSCKWLVRPASTSVKKDFNSDTSSVPQVGLSPDGRTVICWHPEPDFPYEHTKALPRKPEMAEGDSVLKVQYLAEEKIRYRASGPTDKELSNMFFTTKHRWYPKTEKKYKKLRPPKDREYI